jgi:hypothetical protein
MEAKTFGARVGIGPSSPKGLRRGRQGYEGCFGDGAGLSFLSKYIIISAGLFCFISRVSIFIYGVICVKNLL